MRVWNVTIKNFHKGRYWNQEKTLTVKAGQAHVAAYRAAKGYLDQLPRGTRISGLNIRVEAYRQRDLEKLINRG